MFNDVISSLELTLREIEIISFRFGIGRAEAHTLKEVMDVFYIHPEDLRKLEKKVLIALKDNNLENIAKETSESKSLKIFISYAKEDIDFAKKIYNHLTSFNCEPWIDYASLFGGTEWSNEINKEINKSDIFITCFSNNSINKRGFVQKELNIALDVAESIPEDDIFILPLQIDDCNIPSKLSKYHVVNYNNFSLHKLIIPLCRQAIKLGKSIPVIKGSEFISEAKNGDFETYTLAQRIKDSISIIEELNETPFVIFSLDGYEKNIPDEISFFKGEDVYIINIYDLKNYSFELNEYKFKLLLKNENFVETITEIPLTSILGVCSRETKTAYYEWR